MNPYVSMFVNDFDKLLQASLKHICLTVQNLDSDTTIYIGQMAYLKSLSASGVLQRLRYFPDREPEVLPDDKGDFYVSLDRGELRVSSKFKEAWISMQLHLKLDNFECDCAIEHFLLHEIFHYGQNLTGERHREIRRAQRALNCVDYHADASAALSLVFLNAEGGIHFDYLKDWRSVYASAARAACAHLYAFFLAGKEEMTFSTFVRHFTWHLHYHRAMEYRQDAYYDELQLMFEPGISIRGMQVSDYTNRKPPSVTRQWVGNEAYDLAHVPHLFLVAPNFWGVPSVCRFLADSSAYKALIDGIFDGDLSKSAHFFHSLFQEYKMLVGKSDSLPPPGGPPLYGWPKSRIKIDDPLAPKIMRFASLHANDVGRRFLPAVAHTIHDEECLREEGLEGY